MSIELIDKIKPKNNGSFALVDAIDIQVDNNGKRLSTKLAEIDAGGSGDGSSTSTVFAENVIINKNTDERLTSTLTDVATLKTGLEMGVSSETIYREVTPYKYAKRSLYNVNSKTVYGSQASYAHAFFNVTPGNKYYITGSTPSNTNGHPLCAFYDSEDVLLEKNGLEVSYIYTDEEITAPANAAWMVVNKSASSIPAIIVKRAIPSSGMKSLDRLNVSVFDLESAVTDIQASLDEKNSVIMGVILDPTEVGDGCYNVDNGTYYNGGTKYKHATYAVTENSYYFVSGNSLTNASTYPLCAFLDSNNNILGEFGTDPDKQYDDFLVKAPMTATQMIVNKSWTNVTILAKTGIASAKDEKNLASTRSYNLDMADSIIRMHKSNPFVFKSLDKGYVTFIFDDLCNDIDSVASLFEQYNSPVCLAAIPDNMNGICSGLTATRGNFTVGMTKKAVMEQVVTNGGEILAHNSAPVITETNQYDYDFMYGYFCTAKQNLNNAGFYPRGIIRAGGTGAINRSTEIDRWLIGNYEYANMGTLPQYNWDRVTIQQSQTDLKNAILAAKNNKTWLRFMCHSYNFDNSNTFTGEADLIELLEYCQTIGIDIVTVGHIFDTYGSTEFKELLLNIQN